MLGGVGDVDGVEGRLEGACKDESGCWCSCCCDCDSSDCDCCDTRGCMARVRTRSGGYTVDAGPQRCAEVSECGRASEQKEVVATEWESEAEFGLECRELRVDSTAQQCREYIAAVVSRRSGFAREL